MLAQSETPTATNQAKGPFVAAMQPGERIVGFYMVADARLEPFRDPAKGKYLSLTLADKTGQIKAKAWENAQIVAEAIKPGEVVRVAADVKEYQERPDLIVHKIRPAAEGEYELADFLPATDQDTDELLAGVQAAIAGLKDDALTALVKSFYDDPVFLEELCQAPVTRRMNHAYLGGLLEHVHEMLALGDTMKRLYPVIDGDLLTAGILLCNIGKLREYSATSMIDDTDEGELLGHIVLGLEMLNRAIAALPDFPAETALRIKHLMAAQSGRLEFGSPARPQMLEAIVLHQVEMLSAKTNHYASILARKDPRQSWTERDAVLGLPLYGGDVKTKSEMVEE